MKTPKLIEPLQPLHAFAAWLIDRSQKYQLGMRELGVKMTDSPAVVVAAYQEWLDSTAVIDSFQGHNRWLSNFWSCFIELDGVEYPSVENAYQAAKTMSREARKPFETIFPSEAKRLGRELVLRPDWENIKLLVMTDCLRQKFADGELGRRLAKTWPAQLVEGNNWGDRYWGMCQGIGENHLGKLLMKIREEHRTEDLTRAMNGG